MTIPGSSGTDLALGKRRTWFSRRLEGSNDRVAQIPRRAGSTPAERTNGSREYAGPGRLPDIAAMSIAPLHGRPAPLVFVVNERKKWPRYRPAALRRAPLSTRARRERYRRRARSFILAGVSIVLLAASWLLLSLRG